MSGSSILVFRMPESTTDLKMADVTLNERRISKEERWDYQFIHEYIFKASLGNYDFPLLPKFASKCPFIVSFPFRSYLGSNVRNYDEQLSLNISRVNLARHILVLSLFCITKTYRSLQDTYNPSLCIYGVSLQWLMEILFSKLLILWMGNWLLYCWANILRISISFDIKFIIINYYAIGIFAISFGYILLSLEIPSTIFDFPVSLTFRSDLLE